MARYVVTGGCGFIGSQLTKKLIAQNHEVWIIDDMSNGCLVHPNATLIRQDIAQHETLQGLLNGMDGCFHLAAIPSVDIAMAEWQAAHATNLQGSLNVFKAAIEAGNIPVVYASSCAVYGQETTMPLCETNVAKPISAYGCDKLSTEFNAFFLANGYALPSVGLRLFNVYGPYQSPGSPYAGVITRFIEQMLHHKPLEIFGDGEQTRDYVFIDDVVDAFIHAMNQLKTGAEVYNVCTGPPISLNPFID